MSINEPPHSLPKPLENIHHSRQENRSRLQESNLKDHLSTISEEKTEIMQRPLSAKPYSAGKRELRSPRSETKSKKTKFVNEFQTVLAKINVNQTRELGMREAQKMILSNQTPQALRIYLSSLTDHHQKQTLTSGSREMVVLLLGYIVSLYKTNLLDPIDQPPDLIKTVVRISETVHGHFKDDTPSVQQACARTLNELYVNCLIDCDIQTVSLIMVEPLLSILNGGADRISQHTAAVCLCDFLYLLVKKGARDLIIYLSEKIYQLYLKTSHEFVELIRSIGICLSIARQKNLPERVFHLINRLSSSIRRNIPQASVGYQVKIECCNVIAIIARIFKRDKASIPGDLSLIYNRVAEMLRDLSKHKIYKVQQAAAVALKVWEDLNRSEDLPDGDAGDGEDLQIEFPKDDLPVERTGIKELPPYEEPVRDSVPKSYKSRRDQLKKAKKQEQAMNNDEIQVTESKDLKDVIEKNINDYLQNAVVGVNKTQDFVKARSGNGGGYAGWSADNQIQKRPSYEMQKRHLKDLILGKKPLLRESVSVNDLASASESHREEFSAKKSVVKKIEASVGKVTLGKIELGAKKIRKRYSDPDEKEPNYFEGIKISTQQNGITGEGLTPQRDIQKIEVPLKRTRQATVALHKQRPATQGSSPEKRFQLTAYEQHDTEEHSNKQQHQLKTAMRYADDELFAESQTFGVGSRTMNMEHYNGLPKESNGNVEMNNNIQQQAVEQGQKSVIPTKLVDQNQQSPAKVYGTDSKIDLVNTQKFESNNNSDDESVDKNFVESTHSPPKAFVREPQFRQPNWYPLLEQNQSKVQNTSTDSHSLNYKIEKNAEELKSTKETETKSTAPAEKIDYATRKMREIGRQIRPQTATAESTQAKPAYSRKGEQVPQSHAKMQSIPQEEFQPIKKAEIHPPQSYTAEKFSHSANNSTIEPTKPILKPGVRFADNETHDIQPHIRLNEFPKEQQDYFLPIVNKYQAQTTKHEQNNEKPYSTGSLLDERPIRPMSQQQIQQYLQPVQQNEFPQDPLHDTWDEEAFERKRNRNTKHDASKLEDTMLWETMTSTEIRQKFSDIPVYEGPETQTVHQITQEPHKREIKPPQIHQPLIERKIEMKPPQKPVELPPVKKTKLIPQEDVTTLDIWHQALEKVGQGDFETAYNNILATGDDVYLVRLLNVTGPCLKKLQTRTTVTLMKRLTGIMKSGLVEKLSISFLENAGKNGLTYALQPNDQQTLFSTLYKLASSSNAVGKKSAQLYTELRNK